MLDYNCRNTLGFKPSAFCGIIATYQPRHYFEESGMFQTECVLWYNCNLVLRVMVLQVKAGFKPSAFCGIIATQSELDTMGQNVLVSNRVRFVV